MCISGPHALEVVANISWGVFTAIRESDTNKSKAMVVKTMEEVLERAVGV